MASISRRTKRVSQKRNKDAAKRLKRFETKVNEFKQKDIDELIKLQEQSMSSTDRAALSYIINLKRAEKQWKEKADISDPIPTTIQPISEQ